VAARSAREEIRSGLHALRHEEAELIAAALRGRPGARARLTETFTPLIGQMARAYAGVRGVDRAELMQEGVVGLLRALERYDLDQGTPFWAYASWWVRQAMQQLVSELSRPVVLSDRAMRELARMRAARRELAGASGREPTRQEIAAASGLSLEQVDRLISVERRPWALDERRNGPDGPGPQVEELLPDPRAEDAYDEVVLRLDALALPRLLGRLSARQCRVIAGRFGFGGRPRTLRELGGELGMSAERVRQIEQGSLEEMRSACGETSGASAAPTTLAS
jgi:RNA polymerase sigma factor (sigma-70 family)